MKLKGSYRNYIARPIDFQMERKDLNTLSMNFKLRKGSYATIFLREFLDYDESN